MYNASERTLDTQIPEKIECDLLSIYAYDTYISDFLFLNSGGKKTFMENMVHQKTKCMIFHRAQYQKNGGGGQAFDCHMKKLFRFFT